MEKTTYEMPIESKNSNALIVIDFDNVNNTFLVQNTSNGNFCIFLPDKKLIEIGNSDFSNFPFVQRGISSSRTDIISSECKPPLLKKPEPFLDQKINNENSILFSKNPTQSSPTTTQYEHERTSTPPLPTRRNRSNKHSWFSRLRDIWSRLNMGAGGTSGPTQDTISEPFVCSAGGIWTFGGQNVAITSLDCVSAAGR
uniref:Uncharacterized protein n=1 Tax=Acrobeloides nanus TaxID=290746 RepID=A0A914CKS7_9BILA